MLNLQTNKRVLRESTTLDNTTSCCRVSHTFAPASDFSALMLIYLPKTVKVVQVILCKQSECDDGIAQGTALSLSCALMMQVTEA